MANSLAELVPDSDVLVGLEPEELGLLILRVLAAVDADSRTLLNKHNFLSTGSAAAGYPRDKVGSIRAVLVEGWAWLEREGLIVKDPSQHDEWIMLSRRGRALAAEPDLRSYQQARVLPRASLHPALLEAGVESSFIRGDYDTAVFQAFRTLEVRVRAASGASANLFGDKLMRTAFDEANGPLRPSSEVKSEREALAHLMAGAIGVYKNPQSHREVGIEEAAEAAEIVLFASHLLRTVDRLREVKR